MRINARNKHEGINMTMYKTLRQKKITEMMKRSSKSLFQTIYGLFQFIDKLKKLNEQIQKTISCKLPLFDCHEEMPSN